MIKGRDFMAKSEEILNEEKSVEESNTDAETTLEDGINKEAREKDAQNIVTNHMLFAVGFGTVPVPVVDIVGLSATQLNMLRKLSEVYGESFTDELAKKAIASLIGGSLTIPVAMGVSSLIKSLPIIGQSAGAVSIASVGSALTYAIGQVFIRHFESGGTLISFEPSKVKEFFKEEFDKGKGLVKDLVKSKKSESDAKETNETKEENKDAQ
jgi:uncharacterized protein (DUF697 family)